MTWSARLWLCFIQKHVKTNLKVIQDMITFCYEKCCYEKVYRKRIICRLLVPVALCVFINHRHSLGRHQFTLKATTPNYFHRCQLLAVGTIRWFKTIVFSWQILYNQLSTPAVISDVYYCGIKRNIYMTATRWVYLHIHKHRNGSDLC